MDNTLISIAEDVRTLSDRLLKLHERLGYIEQHHGDALTEFGQRLADIEQKHGDALVALGQGLVAADRSATEARRNTRAQPVITAEGAHMPPGTFLGHIPERYHSQLGKYRVLGGKFGEQENSITYGNGDMVRFYALAMVFDLVQKDKIPGDVAELGVYKGDTAALFANFARKMSKTLYLLDTFEGFDVRDLEAKEQHLNGAFADTALEYVRSRVGEENTFYIKGFFPETAAQLDDDRRYSIVHIDTDLYAPIKAGLEYFYPRLNAGGFLIMHDYMSLCWDGAIRAIDEFFADKPEFIIPIPDVAGTVMIRKLG